MTGESVEQSSGDTDRFSALYLSINHRIGGTKLRLEPVAYPLTLLPGGVGSEGVTNSPSWPGSHLKLYIGRAPYKGGRRVIFSSLCTPLRGGADGGFHHLVPAALGGGRVTILKKAMVIKW